jgi:hypothetical protein
MPNKPPRDKKNGPQNRKVRGRAKKLQSINDLLGRTGGRVGAVLARAQKAQETRSRVAGLLPPALASKVTGAVDSGDGRVVVFTESAVWSARVRIALTECEEALRAAVPGLRSFEVKVLPPGN